MVKLSVLTTIYNSEEYIEDLFKSIQSQTFTDFEWIIVDDGSTDKTWDMLVKFSEEDARIHLHRLNENKGVGYASSVALSLAQGEYVAIVDGDDVCQPKRFQMQIDVLQNNLKIDVVDSYIDYFPHNYEAEQSERYANVRAGYMKRINRPLTPEEISDELWWTCAVVNSAVMARIDKVREVGYSKTRRLGEDYQLFYEMNKKGMKFFRIPQKLMNIRISMNSIVSQMSSQITELLLQLQKDERDKFFCCNPRQLAIWGAGMKGIQALDFIKKEYEIFPAVFIDSDPEKAGREIEGIPIVLPKESLEYKICIASSYGKDEIIESLRTFDCKPLEDYYVYP